ncbi:hypothetical protein ACOMHN_021646 [Nucella lapillus]
MKEVVAGLKRLLTENTSETWKAESLLIEQLAKQVRGRKPESEEKVKMWMKRELSNDKFLKELIHPEPLRGKELRDFKRKVSKLVNQSWEKLLKTEGKQLPSVSTSEAPASDSVTNDDCILEEVRVPAASDSVTIDDCILEEPRVPAASDSVTNDDCILEEVECSLEEPRVPAASDSMTIDDCSLEEPRVHPVRDSVTIDDSILEEVQVPAASDSMTIDDCSLEDPRVHPVRDSVTKNECSREEPRVPPVSDSVTKNECACSLEEPRVHPVRDSVTKNECSLEEPRVPPVSDSVTNDECSLEEAQGSSVSHTVTKNFCILEEPRVPPTSDSVTNDFCILEEPWVPPTSDSVINDDCSLEELLDSCDVDPTFLEQSIPSQDWFLAEVTQNGSTVPDISFAEINDEHHLFPPPPTWTPSQVQSAAPHDIYTQAGYTHTIVSSSGQPCFDEFGTRLTSSTMVSCSPLNGWQLVQRDRVYTPPKLPVVWTASRPVMSVRQVGSSHTCDTSLPAPPPPSDVLHVEPSVDMDEEGSVCNCGTDEEGSWDSWDEVDEDRSDYSTSSEASGDELTSEDSCYYSHGSEVDEAPGEDLDALDEAPRVQDEAPRDKLNALVEAPRDQLNALDEAPRDQLDAPPSPPPSVLENEVPPCRKRKQEEECEVPIKLAKVLEPCPAPPATPYWGDHTYAASRELPPSSSLSLPNPLPSSPHPLSGEAANVSAAELHPRLLTSSPQQPPLSSPVQVGVVLSQAPPPTGSASDVHTVPRSHEHEDPFSDLQGLDIYATLKKLIAQAQDNLGTLDTVDRENPVRNAVEKKNCFPRDSLSDEQFRKA